MNIFYFLWKFRNGLIIILTPIVFLPLPLLQRNSIANCGYVLCIMSVYWTTEACPLAVTALLPVVMFPLFGILSADVTSMAYMRQLNFLFIGGLLVAVAIEEWNLHRRIALRVLLMIGSRPGNVLFGFMLVTWLLSMWISNTATTAMMVPVAMAVHSQMTSIQNEVRERNKQKAEIEAQITVPAPAHDTEETSAVPDITSPAQSHETEETVTATGGHEPTFAKLIPEKKADTNEELTLEQSEKETLLLRKAMLLAVAYSANIGGFATLIGTPVNLILPAALDAAYGDGAGDEIDFLSWLGFCFPISTLCLAFTWYWLVYRFLGGVKKARMKSSEEVSKKVEEYLKKFYDDLGPFSFGEKAVFVHFLILAILWISRDPKVVTGWKDGLGLKQARDSTTAILFSFSLLVFPSKIPFLHYKVTETSKDAESQVGKQQSVKVPPLLQWKVAQKRLAWDVVLLLGSGFSLAKAADASGLTDWVGAKISVLADISPGAFTLIISITISLLTEVTSNTSTASVFLPLLSKLSLKTGANPLFVGVPATIASSFAFSLPIATPPNAIAFSYGSLRVMDLVSTGLVLNFVCVLILNLFINTTGIPIFKLNEPSSIFTTTTLANLNSTATTMPSST